MAVVALTQAACEFRCLGPVTLTGAAGVALSLRTRKQVALLYYLARRPGRPVARDELIELLWSSDAPKAARHSLSQSASLVNKAIGAEAVIASGRDRLVLRPGVLALDVADFERLAAGGQHEEAMRLWRGGLLEGIWIRRAPNFERWLGEERERCLRLFRRLAHARLEALRGAGDHATMRDQSERLLEYDPLDEKAMLMHLESLTLLDDRSLGLRRYAEFEQRLRKELDAEPGSALRSWAKRHRRGDSGIATYSKMPVSRISEITVLPTAQPLFGRTEEFALLWNAWDEAQRGKSAFIIVEGEAGIGKTALATKLVNQAHVAGGSVCYVKCYRTEKSVPFAPITAIIRQLSRLPGFVALDPVWIGELTRLVPELRERYPNAPQPMAVDDAARHRLSDATSQAASAVADEQPLMIAVDDLQDADEATLALLHYIGRCQQPSVFVVAGWRHEAVLSEYQKAFFETVQATGFARRVVLKGLAEKEVERLVSHVAASRGTSLAESAVAEVARRAHGNPLHVIEAVLSAVQPSDPSAGRAGRDAVKQDFDASARERFSGLPPASQLVAKIVGLAGHPLSEFELAELSQLKPAELGQAVLALESAQFARRAGARLGLVHEQYSATIEAHTGAAEGTALHLRLAEMLAQSAASNPAVRYEAARHYAAAGDMTKAREHAESAAHFAARLGAVRSRVEALELVRRASDGPAYDTNVLIGQCYLELNEFDRLHALCERLRSDALLPRKVHCELAYLEAALAFDTGRQSLSALEKVLEELLESKCPFQHRGPATILLMRIADKTGNYRRTKALARQLRRSQVTGMPRDRFTMFAAGYVFCKYYRPGRAISLLRGALTDSQSHSDWSLESLSRDGLAIALKQIGKYQDSIREFNLSLAFARRTMNANAEARCLQNRAVSEIAVGELNAALESIEESDKICNGSWSFMTFNAYNRAIVYLLSREHEKAITAFQHACELAERHCMKYLLADSLGGLALAYLRLGNELAFKECSERAALTDNPFVTKRASWTVVTSECWHRAVVRGEPEQALAALAVAARQARGQDVTFGQVLQLEWVYLSEWVSGGRALGPRASLADDARSLGAGWIVAACEQS